jgi:uncharacterized protein YecE (DUF72 family)
VILVGTSGWQYRHWRGSFYPSGLAQTRWLPYYADTFATVEINSAFYRLPARSTFQDWREQTPQDFRASVKMSRYLTHIRRLREPADPVARFLDRAAGLGDRLGPVLLQLPPNLRADPDALAATLEHFPRDIQVVVEPRHASWWTDELLRVLRTHGAALCWADRRGRPITPLWRTAGFGYLRLHEGRASPWPRYGTTALRSWVRRAADAFGNGAPVYVYFNNDQNGAAPVDAAAFAGLCRRHGLDASRSPPAPARHPSGAA